MAANERAIAIMPDLRSSLLTFGPTFSTLLKLKSSPIELDSLLFIFLINSLSFEFFFSNFTIKSVSLPNCFTLTFPRFICLNESLIIDILALFLEVRISINVPPLKSTPKFNPLKINNKSEIIIRKEDNILKKL